MNKPFRTGTLLAALLFLFAQAAFSQKASPVSHLFPPGTVTHADLNYAGDTLQKHLLDLYLPPNAGPNTPLVVWIHGGAWMLNDKYADMGYMKQTVRGFIDSGYALASIDYRYSTTAPFPAQVQDCNRALQFLHDNARKYRLDSKRIALIGFSAGGHLASLLALAHNNNMPRFYSGGRKGSFSIRCVLDFYGPSDLLTMSGSPDTSVINERSPVSLLLGALPVERPDLARLASPVTYIDANDPPFFIVQGEKDESVPNTQSKLLHAWFRLKGVRSELIVVPNAPHYGPMFDADEVRKPLFRFLAAQIK